ncbi:MAG: hypothetical protein HPY90_12075 [Syntrophothermus sp.]|uniref:hypothetical protein n=1 Tax=Syntrophothermus sp. TaxID=2736299 RepID=UPI00257E819C|nr:hypothetical protein [Syntrophothermus sp.]NSW83986.1 hypothetical protein [Syntrophothermus sp.]
MLELTERDRELLDLIAKAGIITFEQAKKVFPSKQYYYHRVRKLRQNGYVKTEGGYIRLGRKGKSEVGLDKEFRPSDQTLDSWAQFGNICLELSNWEIVSQARVRTFYNLGRDVLHMRGIVRHGRRDHLLYLLRKGGEKRVGLVKAELERLKSAVGLDSAVVFCDSPKTMQAFGEDPCGMRELMLLPYPYGALVMNAYITPEYQDYLKKLMPGALTEQTFADRETPGCYYADFILNDLVKRANLKAALPFLKKPVKIVCLPSQQELFERIFPGLGIVVAGPPV